MQTAVAPFSVDTVSMNLFELTMFEKQLVRLHLRFRQPPP